MESTRISEVAMVVLQGRGKVVSVKEGISVCS
jgi:hypothetical protein